MNSKTRCPNDATAIQLTVSRGMVQFIKDHAAILQELGGTRTPEDFFENSIILDFNATLDAMHLKPEEIYKKYAISSQFQKSVGEWHDKGAISGGLKK
jgi:hypothetical protein